VARSTAPNLEGAGGAWASATSVDMANLPDAQGMARRGEIGKAAAR
jgi:hypothetical protein